MEKLKNIINIKINSRYPIILFLIVLTIIFILTNLVNKPFNKSFIDEIIFFKFIKNKSIEKNKENNNKIIEDDKIKIYISSNNDFEINNICLFDLAPKNVRFNKKIAPGSNGSFTLQLFSNMNINYNIRFEELSRKPKNMLFKVNEMEYQNLEDLNGNLNGSLENDFKKELTIFWNWNYESDLRNDEQDTNDGKKLNTYYFKIYAYGY